MKWQYKTIKVKSNWVGSIDLEKMKEELDSLGRQEWELVNVVANHGQTVAVFKKPL